MVTHLEDLSEAGNIGEMIGTVDNTNEDGFWHFSAELDDEGLPRSPGVFRTRAPAWDGVRPFTVQFSVLLEPAAAAEYVILSMHGGVNQGSKTHFGKVRVTATPSGPDEFDVTISLYARLTDSTIRRVTWTFPIATEDTYDFIFGFNGLDADEPYFAYLYEDTVEGGEATLPAEDASNPVFDIGGEALEFSAGPRLDIFGFNGRLRTLRYFNTGMNSQQRQIAAGMYIGGDDPS